MIKSRFLASTSHNIEVDTDNIDSASTLKGQAFEF